MHQKEINFTALDKLAKFDISLTKAIFFGVSFFALLIWGITNDNVLSGLAIAGLILFGILYLIYQAIHVARKNNDIFMVFTASNGFTFEKENKHINESGSLYQRGHSKIETNIINGEFTGLPMKLSDYNYVTGSGKSRTHYAIRVMRLTLPRQLPHIVIDCEVESDGNGLSSLPITFAPDQKVELEGDFHKYFNLYVPDKYGIPALSIIAPDAMEALMKMKALCDIEIIENQIYFYWPDTETKREKYENNFVTVEEVMKEIGDKLKSSDIFTQKTQGQIHVDDAQNPVKLKKSSLLYWLKSRNAISFYIAAGVFIFFNVSGGSNSGIFADQDAVFLIVFLGVFVLLMIPVLYNYANKYRLKKELKNRYHS